MRLGVENDRSPKTETPQVVDLRCHVEREGVELEGIEPSTSSMPSKARIDQMTARLSALQEAVRLAAALASRDRSLSTTALGALGELFDRFREDTL